MINVQTAYVRPMKPWQGFLLGLIFAIIGFAILCSSVSSIKVYNEKNETYIETNSKVVDYTYNDEGLQAIIVEYVVDGQTYKKYSNTYSTAAQSIGTEVSIKYNPNNPNDAIWTVDSNNIVLPLFGIAFLLIGIFIMFTSFKNRNNQNPVGTQTIGGIYNNQINDFNPQANASQTTNNQNNQL